MDTAITLFFNGSENLYLDSVAMLATKVWVWVPLYAAIFYVVVREHDFRSLLFVLCGLIFAVVFADQFSSSLVKPLVARWRPAHDPAISHIVDTINGYRGGRYGFFSSHAANTAAIATFLSLHFRQRPTTITLFAWCLLNCWTRMYLGVHFFGDILAGLIFGVLVGYGIHRYVSHRIGKAAPAHYSATRLSVITYTFLFLLIIITIPWRVYY